MNRSKNHARLLASLLAASGAALTLGCASASARPESSTHELMNVQTDGGDKVKFERNDDHYTITVNGKEVKSGDVSDIDWDVWDARNDKGQVVASIIRDGDSFSVSTRGEEHASAHVNQLRRSELRAARGLGGAQAGGQGQNWKIAPRAYALKTSPGAGQPRVMLGVTLGTPDDSLASQVGVNPEDATLIESVSKDLPAAQGGLQRSDVVVEADGKTPMGEDALRELLRTKNPGDDLKLKVVRAGEKKDITVKLAAYDPAKLSGVWSGQMFGNNLQREEQTRELRNLADQLRQSAEETARSSGAAASESSRQVEEMARRMSELAQELAQVDSTGFFQSFPGTVQLDPSGSGTVVIQGQAPMAPMTPSMPGLPAIAPDRASLHTLNERMDKLEQQLDRMERMLEKATQEKSPSAKDSQANH